jgi:hypothetical protein
MLEEILEALLKTHCNDGKRLGTHRFQCAGFEVSHAGSDAYPGAFGD